jgi:tetratricopeptide (TPR) repeat protein
MGERSGISGAHYNLGKVEFAWNKIDCAEAYFEKGLHIATELKADSLIVIILYGLGKTSFSKGNIEQARQYYQESLKLYRDMGNRKDIDLNLIRIAELFCNIGNFSDSARLLGFVKEEFVERKKIVFPKAEQPAYDETLKNLKEEIGVEDFAKYFEEGRMLDFDKAIELALTV